MLSLEEQTTEEIDAEFAEFLSHKTHSDTQDSVKPLGSNGSPVFPHSLPPLTETPKAHPGCCLTLSLPLLTFLMSQLPPFPFMTLSIGSGTGLLEALLLSHSLSPSSPSSSSSSSRRLNIQTVEVAEKENQHMPPELHHTVPGTWALVEEARRASGWMFVYPKLTSLVERYLNEFVREEKGAIVKTILWIGPAMDWEDFEGMFRTLKGWKTEVWNAKDVGGRAWEVVAITSKTETR
ncbi:hypothetical protein GQ43DRAFT_391476 [Delitschia confertaspora ATCC 74209]|uniref:Uncharacterized protein n=1 Tax=Delitschia confertaspora ATCC 74209 TaxID=1513339 RepID=A0A9P4JPC9_9PLEO|nr:hypothetical protein GQ43DRAFT_391476 [Delitschia confertaspora ATCC 74209]